MSARKLVENWNDIAAQLLKIGATAYGGPAIMGIMQAELQEKRQWVSKERFVEGLSLVNMLPGATAAHLPAVPLGVPPILLLAGGVGIGLFHSRKLGVPVLVPLAAFLAVVHIVAGSPSVPGVVAAPGAPPAASLLQVGAFLLKVG